VAEPQRDRSADTSLLTPPDQSYTALEDEIMAIRPGGVLHRRWWLGRAASGLLLAVLVVAVTVLLVQGVGIWGLNVPNVWGLDIVSYAWWIGISNAGLMLAALLALTGTTWRAPINRLAEAMTLFAPVCAAIYPILH
jgi:molybdopterin-containing oxidoreductase family membrane subunit